MPNYGVELQTAAAIETTYDTIATFAASTAVGLESFELEPFLEWHKNKEHLGTASTLTHIRGKEGGRWSAKGYVKPRTTGTPPDAHPFFLSAMGSVTGSAYSLSSVLNSMRLMRQAGGSFQETAFGAWTEELEVEINGNQICGWSASGGYARHGGLRGAPATSASTLNLGVTTAVLSAASAYTVRPGALVAFGANTNSGAGYLVTAVSTDGLTLTFSPALAGSTVAGGSAVTAQFPSGASYAGTVQGGIECSLSVAAVSLGFISYKVKLSTGIHGLDREANANRANRLARGERSVEGEALFYVLDENAGLAPAAWNGTRQAMVARAGTATTNCTITTPATLMKVSKVEIPEAVEATHQVAFVAERSAANDDELTMAFAA